MKYEKSCGALVYRRTEAGYELLMIRHKFGDHWSFPKGHVEHGESERQTAQREVKEETGVSIRIRDGFRESVHYSPKPNIRKQVVYFLAEALNEDVQMQEEEISEIRWAALDTAFKIVSFENDRRLISKARVCLEQ